jgi:hypothetical protein
VSLFKLHAGRKVHQWHETGGDETRNQLFRKSRIMNAAILTSLAKILSQSSIKMTELMPGWRAAHHPDHGAGNLEIT